MPRKQAPRKSTFGTVTCLRSGRYSGRYLDPQGDRRSLGRTYSTEREAWAALALMQADLARGEWFDADRGKVTFAEFAERVRVARQHDLAVRTQQENVYLLRALLPTFGHRALNKISPDLVHQWWGANGDRPVARRNKYGLLSNVLSYAVEWGYLRQSPCRVRKAFAEVGVERPVHTIEEFEAVVVNLPDDLQRACRVLFGAHLRVGELCGLEWRDWNCKAVTLRVERQADRNRTTGVLPTKTKSSKTLRPLQQAVNALQEQQKATPGVGAVPIFQGPLGGRLRAAYVGKQWNLACAAAGIENFHLHDIRHVSLTLMGKESLATIMRRGGHSTARAALRYQAAADEADAAAAVAVDKRLRQNEK